MSWSLTAVKGLTPKILIIKQTKLNKISKSGILTNYN